MYHQAEAIFLQTTVAQHAFVESVKKGGLEKGGFGKSVYPAKGGMEVRGREGGKGTTGKSNKSIGAAFGGAPKGAPPPWGMLLFDFH